MIAEVYPALWSRRFANEGRTGDQHDAFSIAAWLSRADGDGTLSAYLKPELSPPERTVAQVEGWILGATGVANRSKRVRGRETTAATSQMPRTTDQAPKKTCPECGYLFRGKTWGGIDAHWKAFHDEIMPYCEAWPIVRKGGKPSADRAR